MGLGEQADFFDSNTSNYKSGDNQNIFPYGITCSEDGCYRTGENISCSHKFYVSIFCLRDENY